MNHFASTRFMATFWLGVVLQSTWAAAAGQPIGDFTLSDYRGKEYTP